MTEFLMLAFIFLIGGVIAVPIATRLGLGSVLGYLIAGIALSPVLALLDVDVVSIQHFAEFGVVMMLFLVGLELEPKLLWQMRGRLIGLGGGQVVLTTAVVMAAAMLLSVPWTISLGIGLVLALSSTAIVLQTLGEKGLLKSDGGQSSFSVLLTQDIAVIPMLALIPLLAMPDLMDFGADVSAPSELHESAEHADDHGGGHGEDHGDDHGSGMSLVDGLGPLATTGVTLAAIAAVVIGGATLTPPVFRFIAGANLRELFVATALSLVVGIALLMSLVGLSPALGTFLAGVVLANSAYRHELEADIEPFKGLLLGLFFITVGASINFNLLGANLLPIVGLTLGLIAIKALILYGLAVLFKLGGSDRWLFALGLAQAGEFGFVLLSFSTANDVIPPAIADQLLLIVALSMILTPLLFILYDRVIVPRFAVADEREMDEIDEDNEIIVAGYGKMGVVIGRMLEGAGFSATVIDFSAKQLDMLAQFGFKGYYGDVTRPEVLESAGIKTAKILVITIEEPEQATQLVEYVAQNYPHVHIVARANDRQHVYDLWHAGCRDVIRETFDSATRMGRSVYEALGIPREKSDRMVEVFVQTDRRALRDMAEHYDPKTPALENEAYMSRVREMITHWNAKLREENRRILEGVETTVDPKDVAANVDEPPVDDLNVDNELGHGRG
ncbi:MAG: cation:proton antiporter [Pseudomonadota bacterium]